LRDAALASAAALNFKLRNALSQIARGKAATLDRNFIL
jgi:hypothetical protein